MEIGLFFGSFNPPHIGHIIVANHILEYTSIQKIWFIVSPHNPLKDPLNLLEGEKRLFMTQLAIEDYENMEISTIEFKLPRPSYTIDTLNLLKDKYPKEHFRLIMGEDLIRDFPKWKESDTLCKQYKPYIYPRFPFHGSRYRNLKATNYITAPLIEISASFIRLAIKEDKNVRPFLPISVWEYIMSRNLYKKKN